jgi:hypothetical protein
MDQLRRVYYEVVFERDFIKKKSSAFQDFFSEIMGKGYPGDFIRTRPWGRSGDRKNDGYLKSRRILFQVYAPNEMKERDAIAKIEEDFQEALPHWEQFFDAWIFVHNAKEGLGPGVLQKLLDLDRDYPEIKVGSWDFDALRKECFRLNEEDICAVLGPAPSQRDFLSVGFEDLKVVLKTIARQPAPKEPDLSQVPQDKIGINRLSENTASLIQAGRTKSTLVGGFFDGWPDPQFGDEVVQAFKTKYEELRASETPPDRIFQELQMFAGGEIRQDTGHEAAVLAVLAYLFDHCDIFEYSVEGDQK